MSAYTSFAKRRMPLPPFYPRRQLQHRIQLLYRNPQNILKLGSNNDINNGMNTTISSSVLFVRGSSVSTHTIGSQNMIIRTEQSTPKTNEETKLEEEDLMRKNNILQYFFQSIKSNAPPSSSSLYQLNTDSNIKGGYANNNSNDNDEQLFSSFTNKYTNDENADILNEKSNKASLMNLLNNEGDSNYGDIQEDKEKSLIGLLETENSNDDKNISYIDKQRPSLLDLLREKNDDSDDGIEKRMNDSISQQTSLLDLLDNDDSEKPSMKDEQPSLLDLLQENDYDDIKDTRTKKKSTSEKSLLDLLKNDDEQIKEIDKKQDFYCTHNTENEKSPSLLDLLQDDNYDKKQNPRDSRENFNETFLLDSIEQVDDRKSQNDKEYTSTEKNDSLSLLDLLEDSDLKPSSEKSSQSTFYNIGNDSLFSDERENKSYLKVQDDREETPIILSQSMIKNIATRILSLPHKYWKSIHNGNQLEEENDNLLHGEWKLHQELIYGSSTCQYTISTDEYNLLLLQISLSKSSIEEKIQRLWYVYQHMLSKQHEHQQQIVNLDTYYILMKVFAISCHAPRIAEEVCCQMLDHYNPLSKNDGIEDNLLSHNMQEQIQSSDKAFVLGSKCLLYKDNLPQAQRLFQMVCDNHQSHGEGDASAVNNVAHSLVNWHKRENKSQEALQILKQCIDVNKNNDSQSSTADFQYYNSSLEKLILTTIRWPDRSRDGNPISTISHCRTLIQLLLNESNNSEIDDKKRGLDFSYSDVFHFEKIWRTLLLQTYRAASREDNNEKNNPTMNSHKTWEMVRTCCVQFLQHASKSPKNIRLSPFIIKLGLETAEKLEDSKLAFDILSFNTTCDSESLRPDGFEESLDSILQGHEKSNKIMTNDLLEWEEDEYLNESEINEYNPREAMSIPLEAYFKVLKLCISQNELKMAKDLLFLRKDNMPESSLSQLFTIVLAGCAKAGHLQECRQILEDMQNDGPKPTVRTYAAYIHALAVNKERKEALAVLDSLLLDDSDIRPNISCFEACMLSAMQTKQWQDVLDLFDKMKEERISPNASTFYGVILAASRLDDGGKEKVTQIVQQAIHDYQQQEQGEKGLPLLLMDRNIYQFCMKLYLPNLLFVPESNNTADKRKMNGDILDDSIETIRKALRTLSENNPKTRSLALQLSRDLRMAEVEDRRTPSKMKSQFQLEKERAYLWTNVIKSIIELSNIINFEDVKKSQ